uniref:Uncharacterized protein n=1 Tax=Rhodnius prolixus TaxID=13249 RepID=T1HPQ9_RHOPR
MAPPKNRKSQGEVPTTVMMYQVGSIPEFNIITDDWQIHEERLEQYFIANNIPENKKVPVLLTLLGAAENSVKSFKLGIKKLMIESKGKANLETSISRYLYHYRTSEHSTTGETPAKLMFGRELRTRWDALQAHKQEASQYKQIQNYKGHRRT